MRFPYLCRSSWSSEEGYSRLSQRLYGCGGHRADFYLPSPRAIWTRCGASAFDGMVRFNCLYSSIAGEPSCAAECREANTSNQTDARE